jgi:biopolymer transport protein ExbD
MRLRKIQSEVTEPDMTPMIDIIFLLLTFFMIAINFENSKADERVKLPKDMVAKPPSVKPEHELVLNFGYQRDEEGNRIRSLPEVFYNERFVEVPQIMDDLLMEKRVMERIHGPEVLRHVTVLIRADSEIPAGLVQELIRKCQDVGFSKFSLRARTEESSTARG